MKLRDQIKKWTGKWNLNGIVNTRQIPFALFLSLLAIIAIRSGHSVDEKVHEISRLESQLKELEAEYLESKSKLMQLGMESEVIRRGTQQGLIPSQEPPQKLIVEIE